MSHQPRGQHGTAQMRQSDYPPEPSTPPPASTHPWPASQPPESMLRRTAVYDDRPGVEIELVREPEGASFTEDGWCLLAIWTLNRVYRVDCHLRCMEVRDPETDAPMSCHPLLGARLVGGKHLAGDMVHLTQPVPRPGSVAVFEQPTPTGASISESSLVKRVVLRLQQRSLFAGDMPLSLR